MNTHLTFLTVVYEHNYPAAEFLLRAGHDSNYVGSSGYAAMHVTTDITMLQLLIQYQGNINLPMPDTGNTLLHVSAAQNDWKCASFLLEHGADPSLKNKHGQTALDLAKKPSWFNKLMHRRMVYTLLTQHLNTLIVHQIQETLECPICLMVLNQPVTLICGHTFCLKCITGVQQLCTVPRIFPCPVDRFPIEKKFAFHINVALQKILEHSTV